ncbi:hypothetical protein [Blastomonas aquatica]|uniref:hypothetical protein n=1 Tax=Blastomonas aquatica TaxID=1510276 RepID=UPI00166DF810|nr:hypothetical protein [Blastomonas aquatica]
MAFLSLLFVLLCVGDYRNRPALARAAALPFFTEAMQKCPDAAKLVAEKLVPVSLQG